MKKVVKVSAKDFKIICEFNDGKVVEYDMGHIQKEQGPMIEPLKEKSFFKRVFVQDGDVVWPNGYDLNPEVIYREGRTISEAS
jgi:hypothetical protein